MEQLRDEGEKAEEGGGKRRERGGKREKERRKERGGGVSLVPKPCPKNRKRGLVALPCIFCR